LKPFLPMSFVLLFFSCTLLKDKSNNQDPGPTQETLPILTPDLKESTEENRDAEKTYDELADLPSAPLIILNTDMTITLKNISTSPVKNSLIERKNAWVQDISITSEFPFPFIYILYADKFRCDNTGEKFSLDLDIRDSIYGVGTFVTHFQLSEASLAKNRLELSSKNPCQISELNITLKPLEAAYLWADHGSEEVSKTSKFWKSLKGTDILKKLEEANTGELKFIDLQVGSINSSEMPLILDNIYQMKHLLGLRIISIDVTTGQLKFSVDPQKFVNKANMLYLEIDHEGQVPTLQKNAFVGYNNLRRLELNSYQIEDSSVFADLPNLMKLSADMFGPVNTSSYDFNSLIASKFMTDISIGLDINHDIKNIETLGKLHYLFDLDLYLAGEATTDIPQKSIDISWLTQATNLSTFWLHGGPTYYYNSGCCIFNLTYQTDGESLVQQLSIAGAKYDYEIFENFKNLRDLDYEGSLEALSILSSLNDLDSLSLQCIDVQDLQPFTQMTNIWRLGLENSCKNLSLSPLSTLSGLIDFRFSGSLSEGNIPSELNCPTKGASSAINKYCQWRLKSAQP
jgi:hypothetical protein